jgi:hypothetical protein
MASSHHSSVTSPPKNVTLNNKLNNFAMMNTIQPAVVTKPLGFITPNLSAATAAAAAAVEAVVGQQYNNRDQYTIEHASNGLIKSKSMKNDLNGNGIVNVMSNKINSQGLVMNYASNGNYGERAASNDFSLQ